MMSPATRTLWLCDWIVEGDGCDHARVARIGNVENRRAEKIAVGDVPDEGVPVADGDLPRAGEIKMREAPHLAGKRGARPLAGHDRASGLPVVICCGIGATRLNRAVRPTLSRSRSISESPI
jgi:hypothetical protein